MNMCDALGQTMGWKEKDPVTAPASKKVAVAKAEAEMFVNKNPKQVPSRAAQLARAHWEWLEKLLDELNIEIDRSLRRFIYITSFEHGYKHGIQDIQKGEIL